MQKAVKNLKKYSGCQMPPQGYWGVKCHLRLLGRQMPVEDIGASNATLVLLGRQMPPCDYRGVKGHTGIKRGTKRGAKG
jgi:hypothetical protein